MTDVVSGGDTHTTVFFKTNDEGKKVKVTRTIRSTYEPVSTPEDRASWQHYSHGAPINVEPKNDKEIKLVLALKSEEQPKKVVPTHSATCKFCSGKHLSMQCPIKDKVVTSSFVNPVAPAAAGPTPGKYVPVSRRGAPGPGDAFGGLGAMPAGNLPANLQKYAPPTMQGGPGMGMGHRDSENTLRVSNIPEDVEEMYLRRFFSRAGSVVRCHISRHRDTKQSRGFAFIAYATRSDAERAKEAFDGKAIGPMIIHVDFAQPRTN